MIYKASLYQRTWHPKITNTLLIEWRRAESIHEYFSHKCKTRVENSYKVSWKTLKELEKFCIIVLTSREKEFFDNASFYLPNEYMDYGNNYRESLKQTLDFLLDFKKPRGKERFYYQVDEAHF